MKTKEITLTIAGADLNFNVTTLAYNSYVNDLTPTNKVAPSIQFINRAINKDDADKLKTILTIIPAQHCKLPQN